MIECETCGFNPETDEPGSYAVHCGCEFHGDHLGCHAKCHDFLGCTHPIGEEVTCDHTRQEIDMGPTQSRAAVGIVLQELKSRGGFDHWWDDIDEETQQEIIDTLVEKLIEYPL